MPEGAVKLDASYNIHEHLFDRQLAEEQYLKEEGVYYLSCSCGASSKGSEDEGTFTLAVESPSAQAHPSEKPSLSQPSGGEPSEEQEKKEGGATLAVLGGVACGGVAIVALVTVILLKKKKKA